MTIFICGYSRSGKSTMAVKLAQRFGMRPIQASRYTRESCSPEATREELTKFGVNSLISNPDVCIDFTKKEIEENKEVYGADSVLEGVRNPRDFSFLFNPNKDLILFLFPSKVYKANIFDMGVDVISSTVDWMIDIGWMDKKRRVVQRKHELTDTREISERFSLVNGLLVKNGIS